MKYPKRSQYKYAKSRYRVRNWAEYEAGHGSRGDLNIWLSDTALDSWRAPPTGMPGSQRTYADIAAALTIRMVFHLPLRQTPNSVPAPQLQVHSGVKYVRHVKRRCYPARAPVRSVFGLRTE